ncbi:MAG: oxygenase MpaB family protein [Steroidobacteraceae bacterium]
MHPSGSIIRLPWALQRRLDDAAGALLNPQQGHAIDFTRPPQEESLLPPDSVSWRVFKNPIALYIGGLAAVILELAEPAVRTGVWEHSTFRQDPLGRLRRTGTAAMVTIYGARSLALPMIARVVGMHAKITGQTPDGAPYRASDARLLAWVHSTAAFGIAEAYSRYAEALSPAELDSFYREGKPVARLYGTLDSPASDAARCALFDSMRGRLEPSPIVFEFLRIMQAAPALPRSFLWMQTMLGRAAVEIIPGWVRERLGLGESHGLRAHERWMVKLAAATLNRIVLPQSPAAQACVRLGLPSTYLYA